MKRMTRVRRTELDDLESLDGAGFGAWFGCLDVFRHRTCR